MPELPEVETVIRTLEKQLGKATFNHIRVLYDGIIYHREVENFLTSLTNETIIGYHRLGKYLVFECQDHYFIAHMRMEGKFYIQLPNEPYDKHVHVIFSLADGRELRYHDTRKFGKMYVYDKTLPYDQLSLFDKIGYDAFDERLTSLYLYQKSRHRKITLKQFLLEQKNIAGIGNIYADEICFSIRLHPSTKAEKLSKQDCENMLYETRRILQGAIHSGGTTIRSYTSSLKVDGRFQLQLKVHEQQGKPCQICGTTIEKKQLSGRGTSYCKTCQKRK